MSDLPTGWASLPFADVAVKFLSGGTPASQRRDYWDGLIPWTTSAPIGMDDLRLSQPQRYISQDGLQNSGTNLIPRGSLLVGTRVGVGKAVVNELDIAISQDLTGVILDHDRADVEFMAYQFKTKVVRSFIDGRKRGTTIQGISRFDLQSVGIVLPPPPEQRAIAAALRAVQDAHDARRRELDAEWERKAALMEDLFTCGLRGESQKATGIGRVPQSWSAEPLSIYVAGTPQNGLYKHADLYGAGTPIIRITDFNNDGLFVMHELNRVRLTAAEVEKYRVVMGDILINRVNSLSHIGKCALVPEFGSDTVFESNMMRFRLDPIRLLPEFLYRYLTTEHCRTVIRGKAKQAVAQASINQSDVLGLRVPVPSPAEQRDIAQVLTACDAKIAALEADAALHDELFRVLLEELMSGRLSARPLIPDGE